jgi:preprotein translocase SecF subunit
VFNLVKYRFWFLGISLLVIIPGFISLLFNGLNLSTDFTGGSTITVRPQFGFQSSDQVETLLKNRFTLQSLQVVLGNDPSIKNYDTVWIKLNTQVDSNVDQALKTALNAKYPGSTLSYAVTDIKTSDQYYAIYRVSGFKQAANVNDIKTALAKLPATGPVDSSASSATATTVPTPAPTATASAKATATPSAVTPKAPVVPTTTAVKIEDVEVGTTNQTVQITSFTQIDSSDTGNKGHVTFPQIQQAILDQHGPYLTVLASSQVGPSVAGQTTQDAILAVIVASFFILLYVWFSFRKVPKAIRYACSAILALLHDVLVVLGIFSILGKYLGIQIDALFITALLTIVGFSVHDTIVVFDRIRENMQRRTTENFDEIVNASLVQTMARSLNTSLTVLFTLLTLTLFTGSSVSVHTFTLTLLIGIFSGTYSSIFNASMILVIWEKGELGFNRLGGGRQDRFISRREREREVRERELATTR